MNALNSRFLGLLFALVAGTQVFAATAPDSIGGKVYHESGGIAFLRNKWELIIRFGADGRYSFLRDAYGFTLVPSIDLLTPPNDGTYVYTRTGDATATLSLSDPTGTLNARTASREKTTSLVLNLTFADPFNGDADAGTSHGGFYLTDSMASRPPPAVNTSVRGTVSPGRPLTAGFVVSGPRFSFRNSVDVLIRVVGPSLAQFGVEGSWADPDFTFYISNSTFNSGTHLGDWSSSSATTPALQKIFSAVGAFPLLAGSKDAVRVIRLLPGPYTVVCSAAAGEAGGDALIEVYFLP